MYAEQALRSCGRCHAAFAVQYEFTAESVPGPHRIEVGMRMVECPRCHNLNPLLLPLRIQRLVVKKLHAA